MDMKALRNEIKTLLLLIVSLTGVWSDCPAGDITGLTDGTIPNLQTSDNNPCALTPGTVCSFVCTTGDFQGGSSLTCGSDDQWTGDCPRACEVFTCAAADLDAIGVTYDCGIATSPYPLETVCTFSCDSSYELQRSQKATCIFSSTTYATEWCFDGWNQPVCERIGCADIVIEHGTCTYTSPRVGAEATCTCDEGFLLEGTSPVTCTANGLISVNWDPDPPKCVPCKK
ncbi:E-selectin-like [Styela clava]